MKVIVFCLMLFAGLLTSAQAAVVAVFDNPIYVNTTGGPAAASDALQALLISQGHTVVTFTGITAADFTAAANSAQLIVFPELLNYGSLAGVLTVEAKTALANYVATGGGVIVVGDYAHYLLNRLFYPTCDFSLRRYCFAGSGTGGPSSLNAAAAAGTPFATGPASLATPPQPPSALNPFAFFPAGGLQLYKDSFGDVTVLTAPFGAGSFGFLAWGYANSPPLGTLDGGWSTVLDTMVQKVASPLKPALISPQSGATLPGTTVTFQWTANGAAVTEWWVYAGSTRGGKQYYDSGSLGTRTAVTVDTLPATGGPVYLRLWYKLNGVWLSRDYQYTATSDTLPAMTSPAAGTTLPGVVATFQWTANSAPVTEWWLYAGFTVGGKQYFDSRSLGIQTTVTTTLPTSGGPVYVRLWYKLNGVWQFRDYQYTAANLPPPALTSPTPNSTLSDAMATFQWTANDAPVTEWWLYVGSTLGGKQYRDTGSLGTQTSVTITTLPTNGSTVYVRLWYKLNGSWQSRDFQYTAANLPPPAITSPAPGSTLSGATATFQWMANSAVVTAWWLYVGSTLGGKQYHDSGSIPVATTSRTVTTLPTNSSTVYVRLWYKVNGAWQFRDVQYTASTPPAPNCVDAADPNLIVEVPDMPLQPVGTPFSDPRFCTTLRRVSNTSDSGGFETQEYSQLQAFSSDNAYLLLISPANYVVRRVSDFSRVTGLDTSGWNAARWYPPQPHTLIHFDDNADTTLRVQTTNVDTGSLSTLFTFPAPYQRIISNRSSDELSEDGRWLAGVAQRSDGGWVIFALDLQNRVLGAQMAIADLYAGACAPDPTWGAVPPDWVGVSPLGNYLVVQWERDGATRCSGLETFNLQTGAFVGRVYDGHQHGDLGVQPDRSEFFMTFEIYHPSGELYLGMRMLPGTVTVSEPIYLRPLHWGNAGHISCRGPAGVCLISASSDPADGWQPFEDELFLLYTDARVRRLAHHRSSSCGYWVQPRGTISRDGRYVAFASDWGRELDCADYGRGDPYVIDLGSN